MPGLKRSDDIALSKQQFAWEYAKEARDNVGAQEGQHSELPRRILA